MVVHDRVFETDEQGFLLHAEDWSEEYAETVAEQDGVRLYDESWGLIG
ncbi:TusE/DsrC/DsvC family sulfur relay protein, partial [Sulfuricaulis sp.]